MSAIPAELQGLAYIAGMVVFCYQLLNVCIVQMVGWRRFTEVRRQMVQSVRWFIDYSAWPPNVPEKDITISVEGCLIRRRSTAISNGTAEFKEKGFANYKNYSPGKVNPKYRKPNPFDQYQQLKENYRLAFILDRIGRGSIGNRLGFGVRRGLWPSRIQKAWGIHWKVIKDEDCPDGEPPLARAAS